ncbi:MAG: aminopeptidase P family protein [Alphaproteobacteria bacterium]
MRAAEVAYQGDETLARLLAEAAVGLSLAEVKALVRGVVAAPKGSDADVWLELAVPEPGEALREQLTALKRETAAAFDDGLDGRCPPARLAALRAELARRGLDGFVVPLTDEHHGEFIPRRARRLSWLTGFAGSAGVAVVLRKAAAVFVDGRYTLQVEAEVDHALFERRHITDSPPETWIGAHLPAGATLGYDPWLHTLEGVARLKAAAQEAGGQLAPASDNPVDRVWTNQAPVPIAPVVAHDLAFAGVESGAKRAGLAKDLKRRRVEAAVLTGPDSIAWLLNIRGGDVPNAPLPLGFALLHADARVDLFIDQRKLAPGLEAHLGHEVRVHAPDRLGPAIDELVRAGKRLQADPATTAAWVFDRIEAAGGKPVKAPDPCALPKACKNPVELDGARAAHRRDGAALTRFLCWLAGMAPSGRLTELEAAEKLARLREGSEHYRGPSFTTISGAGPNGAIVHYRATPETNRRLEAGSLYLVDSGGQYLDGTTDVTRTVAIGEPTPEQRRHFTAVLKGHIALARTRFPKGTTGAQLDTVARHALWQLGLDYDHGTGHGVGSYLGVHEGPQRIAKRGGDVALEPGMICSNEPGYYKAGSHGIRIESLVAVVPSERTEAGERDLLELETLTRAPIDRMLIDPDLMARPEIAWLEAYHAEVRSTLTPLVDAETAAWLEEVTRPLGT